MPEPFVEQIRITNETQNLVVVRDFITRMVQKSGLRKSDENKIKLAVDEAISNIIEHAYEAGRSGTIDIEVRSTLELFEIYIRDSGKHFDPGDLPNIDIQSHVKTGRRHGLGIFLMRQIMDEVEYRYKEGLENELRLVKYVQAAGSA